MLDRRQTIAKMEAQGDAGHEVIIWLRRMTDWEYRAAVAGMFKQPTDDEIAAEELYRKRRS